MVSYGFDRSDYLREMAHSITTQKEDLLRTQLAELIENGDLIVEETQPVIVQDYDTATGANKVRFSHAVKLRTRDADKLAELRKELAETRAKLDAFYALAGDQR